MNDRELMELAAKAAGYCITPHPNKDAPTYWLKHNDGTDPWNPLTDDGDALRLAVKLGLPIPGDPRNFRGAYMIPVTKGRIGSIPSFEDQCAAVRRTIVCAAAEIGRVMP